MPGKKGTTSTKLGAKPPVSDKRVISSEDLPRRTPGDYIVRILIDDEEIGRKVLFVRALPQIQVPQV